MFRTLLMGFAVSLTTGLSFSQVPERERTQRPGSVRATSVVVHWVPGTPIAAREVVLDLAGAEIQSSLGPNVDAIAPSSSGTVPGLLEGLSRSTPLVHAAYRMGEVVEAELGATDFTLWTATDGVESKAYPIELGAMSVTMRLEPRSVRSPDYRLVISDDAGLHEVEAPPSRTFRGWIVEWPGSVVAISEAGGLRGIVLDERGTWEITPLADLIPGVDRSMTLTHRAVTHDDGFICGGAPTVDGANLDAQDIGSNRAQRGGFQITEMAYDADFEFYTENGSSVSQTNADIEAVHNAVSAVYERDTGIELEMGTVIVRTTVGSNPYSSSNANTLLVQFRDHWRNNHGGVDRDLAHLMTGRDLGTTIGIAYTGVVCSQASGFGLSESRFSQNFNRRTALTAHEIGHNFNAGHCAGSTCKIMCANIGGCGGIGQPNFATVSVNTILNHAGSRNCLSDGGDGAPPVVPTDLSVVSLTTGEALVTWTDRSDKETSFRLTREERVNESWTNRVTVTIGQNETSYVDPTGPGRFRWRIRAVENENYGDWTPWLTEWVTADPPPAPSALIVIDLTDGRAALAWAGTIAATSYTITREERVGSAWTNRVTYSVDGNEVTSIDTIGRAGRFRWRIRSVNLAGSSGWFGWELAWITSGVPAAPSTLDIVDLGDGRARVTWADNAHNEDEFVIFREQLNGGSWGSRKRFTVGPDVTQLVDAPGAGRFRWKVRASNAEGGSAWTPWGLAWVTEAAPAAPSGISAAALGGGAARVTWTDNSANEDEFVIFREERVGTSWTNRVRITVGPDVTTLNDSPGAGRFRWKVRAANDIGASSWTPWFLAWVN